MQIINNKVLLYIIVFSFILLSIGWVGELSGHTNLALLTDYAVLLFVLNSVYLLLKNGEFIHQREYRFIRIGIALIILGVMFKILHIPYTLLFFLLGIITICSIYLFYMIRRKKYNWTYWGKLLFLVSFLSGRLFVIARWPLSEWLIMFSILILAILIVQFIKSRNYQISN